MKNELIKDTINQYYGYRTIYEDFSGLYYVKLLNEMYHISDMFDSAISDICLNIENYTDEYRYTGWNIVNKQCVKCNDSKIGHPIYINRINDSSSIDALSIKDRTFSNNDVLITVNDAYNRGQYIQYDLHHELLHALQMYIGDKNYIENQKTRINFDEELEIIKFLHLSNNILRIFNYLIYYSSRSEQDAHLNATIPYLKDHTITKDMNISNNIIDLIKNTQDFNIFPQYSEYIEILNRWWTNKGQLLNNIFVLGYFYKKYSGDKKANKIKISIHDIENIKYIDMDQKENICGTIFDIIMERYEEYKYRLFSSIMVHCTQG